MRIRRKECDCNGPGRYRRTRNLFGREASGPRRNVSGIAPASSCREEDAMASDGCLVGVFAAREQAERAASELRSEGYGNADLGVVGRSPDGVWGSGGLGVEVGPD